MPHPVQRPQWPEPVANPFPTRLKGPGQVPVLVAHNGRRFDFPVLWDEAKRSNVQLPGSWLYLDSLSMAKALVTNGQDSLKLGEGSLLSPPFPPAPPAPPSLARQELPALISLLLK